MKKILKKLAAAALVSVSLGAVCYAADTIFMGFDEDAVPSNLRPNCAYTVQDGLLSVKGATSTDTFFTYSCNFSADDYDRIAVRVRFDLDERDDLKTPVCQVFYIGNDASGGAISLGEGNSVKTPLGGISSEGEFRTYIIPFNKSNLAGATIKSMRFDVVNCTGSYDIDYIALLPKNHYTDYSFGFNTDGDTEGWSYSNLTSPITVKDGVLSGTNKKSNGLIEKNFDKSLFGGEYPHVYVRMKTSGVASDGNTILYTDLFDSKGNNLKSSWSVAYNGYKYASSSLKASNDGKWVVYDLDFTKFEPYMNNYFKKAVFNCVNKEGPSFNIDYILFKNANSYEWTFDYEGLTEGWSKPEGFSLANGDMVYTCGATYSNPAFFYSDTSIDADSYDGLEIIMKHELKPNGDKPAPESSTVQVYYRGTAADGSVISWAEGNSAKTVVASQSSGESYVRYYIDLAAKKTWNGATIAELRIDPLNDNGDAYISYIRLVPNENVGSKPLDAEAVSVKYEFEDDVPGNADGVISVDIGEQSYYDIKKLTFSWGDENGNVLSDYSMIRAFTSGEFKGSYTINKNMLIPDEAKTLICEIRDSDKSFDVVIDLPENKLPENLGDPLYTAALISDIHIGGWGSEKTPNARLVAARKQIGELADFVVINGDLTQWYGAYSGEEFNAFNYDGTSFKDNGETDITILDQKLGTSQWEVLRGYFDGFAVPVYPVQGNHDIRDGDGWNKYYYQPHYWNDFFRGWLDHSNNDEGVHKYQNKVTYSNTHNYYDAEIFGNHFIFLEMPKMQAPHFYLGDEQLYWLDKKLYEKEATGKPIFVFGHVPTESEVDASYWDDQLKDDAELKKILERHPTAVYVSGHTHYSLDIDTYSSLNGAQQTYSVVNDGGTTTINVPNGTNYLDTTEVTGSHGVFAEVYEDRVLLRGRDFVAGKWLSKGYTLLTMKDSPDFEVSAEKTSVDGGSTVISVKNPDASLEYIWVVDGTWFTSETVTLYGDEDYVALRATDENGVFASVVYDNISDIPEKEKEEKTLEFNGDILKVNADTSGLQLVLASFDGTRLNDVKLVCVSGKMQVVLGESGLDTEGCDRVCALLMKKLSLSPVAETAWLFLK